MAKQITLETARMLGTPIPCNLYVPPKSEKVNIRIYLPAQQEFVWEVAMIAVYDEWAEDFGKEAPYTHWMPIGPPIAAEPTFELLSMLAEMYGFERNAHKENWEKGDFEFYLNYPSLGCYINAGITPDGFYKTCTQVYELGLALYLNLGLPQGKGGQQ